MGLTAVLTGKRVLLIVSGGIAAYKSLELIRRLTEKGAAVRCILTRAGAQFVTPLSLSQLANLLPYNWQPASSESRPAPDVYCLSRRDRAQAQLGRRGAQRLAAGGDLLSRGHVWTARF
jgi:hypothetical protein